MRQFYPNKTVAFAMSLWQFAAADWQPSSVSRINAQSLFTNAGSCCAGLALFLGDKVATSYSSAYNISLASYWSLQEQEVSPSCIVAPTSKEDVSLAVFLLDIGNELFPGSCNFAVRSAGHTPFAGSANIASGIVLDLQNIKQLNLATDLKSIEIGPGNRWINVYDVLEEQGLSSVGGRVGDVGVGGLTTGGGISFYSGRYGYVCDNVLNFEVILASGELVNANAQNNPSLWQALKGGSNNFGVVVSITLPVFERGDIWGGQMGFNQSTIEDQFAAFEAFTGNPDYDPYSALIFNLAWISSTNTWINEYSLEYTKAEELPTAFENFTSLPQTFSTMRITNMTTILNEMSAGIPTGRRQLFATATFKNSAAMLSAIYEIMQEVVQPIASVPSLQWAMSFQPQPIIINSKAAGLGGNSLGLNESDGNLFNVLLNPAWDTEEDDEAINAQVQELFSRMKTKANELDVYHPYIYLNYADAWQDPISSYGADTKQKLQETSKKYDPNGLFQKNVPGGFKLFK